MSRLDLVNSDPLTNMGNMLDLAGVWVEEGGIQVSRGYLNRSWENSHAGKSVPQV